MKTLTEKYRGVLNEAFSKKQFVRDARIAHPTLITPLNGFNDTVKILKNKGYISEEAPKMYGKYELENIKAEDKFSAEAIQRGIDAELEAVGLSSQESVSKEDYAKAKDKAIKNLEKDQNHYLNLMSGESAKVDKHDQMVQADKKNNVDVFNGMKKANLKEAKVMSHPDEIEDGTFPVAEAFKKVGIDMSKDVHVHYQDGGTAGLGGGQLKDKGTQSAESVLKMFEGIRKREIAEYEELRGDREDQYGDKVDDMGDFPIIYEYYYYGDDTPEGKEFKMTFGVFEGESYDIFQESSNVDEEDKKELPKSIADKERDQIEKDAKKAKGMIKEDPKANIIAVAKEIRAKYGEIPGFNVLLKDFLQTHQHEIKAGEVGPQDAIAEFDNFVDANYDRLNEKEEKVNEYRGSGEDIKSIIRDKAADSGFSEQEEAMEVMEFIGQEYEIDFEFGAGPSRQAEAKEKIQEVNIPGDQITLFDALDKYSIRDIMDAAVKYLGKQSGGDMDDYVLARKMAAVDRDAWGDTRNRGFKEAKGKDHDGDGDIDSDDYMAAKDKAIKKAMGKEKQLKEAVKNIIKKTLEEGVVNEAATQELARLADTYGEFEGFKQSIIQLQDIVTDIESYYDKTRSKIQKVYDSIGDIRNEEGLKVGAFLAPSIEAAFNKDLRPVSKTGFTKGLDTPKVKMISKAQVDAAQGMDEEPKQTIFSPVNENKK